MIGFLPLIVIGGLFYPILGYLVLGMMVFFIILSFFKGRYWCWNLCPRGAFLDIVLSKLSFSKPVPKIFLKSWFRWSVFVLFFILFITRILQSKGHLFVLGAVFVMACVITTIISIILGVPTKARSWCMICPMGMLQEQIGKIRKKPIKG